MLTSALYAIDLPAAVDAPAQIYAHRNKLVRVIEIYQARRLIRRDTDAEMRCPLRSREEACCRLIYVMLRSVGGTAPMPPGYLAVCCALLRELGDVAV